MAASWCRYENASPGTVRVVVLRVDDGGTAGMERKVVEPSTCLCAECQDIRRRLERNDPR